MNWDKTGTDIADRAAKITIGKPQLLYSKFLLQIFKSISNNFSYNFYGKERWDKGGKQKARHYAHTNNKYYPGPLFTER